MTDTHIPKYDTAAAVDDALSAVQARYDHADAPYDPDVLGLIRAAEAMRAKLYGSAPDTTGLEDELIGRMTSLLTAVSRALKGDDKSTTTNGWRDLPDVAAETARRAAPPDAPPAWLDLFEGLALLARHQNNVISPFNCTHDQLTVMADPAKFTDEEIARLDDLGFHADGETFYSFRFGSA